MSEPIQAISQNNYILQAPPPTATMFTTELEYDGDKISGYAGSAFKAGTDLEFGYTDADTISSINTSAITDVSLNNIVQTNSGAWGGSALPVSAGPGVKINFVNNTLVFSNDETVLWSGVPKYSGVLTASESVKNFESYKVYISERERGTPSVIEFHTYNLDTSGQNANTSQGGVNAIALTMCQTTNKEFFTINSNHAVWNDDFTELTLSTTGYNKYMSWASSGFTQWSNSSYEPTIRIHKIIGINRK